MKSNDPVCPFCNKKQKQKPLKNWQYLKTISVCRYKCSCDKFFQFYQSHKSSWTIPKPKNIEQN